jgi:Ca2+-binding RTX toxin-like protein
MTVGRKPLLVALVAMVLGLPTGAQATHEGCNHFRDGSDGVYYIIGTNNDDHCHGTSLDETMGGNAGADDLSGRGGNDYIIGHNGHDLLNGDDGADGAEGYDGNDRIVGGNGHDGSLRDTTFGSDYDKICDNAGNDGIYLQDGDGYDIWYREPNDGYDDYHELGPYDAINTTGCTLPGS